jgi:predicted NBD/HSP70 family sugar kinase
VPVAVPEPRDRVGFAPALTHLKGRPLTSDLFARIAKVVGHEIPVELENDGNGMALTEWLYGSARGLTDFIVLRLCTGVGWPDAQGELSERKLLRTIARPGHPYVSPGHRPGICWATQTKP